MLFGKNLYHHNIIQKHVELHLKQAIEPHHFERWLSLFCQVVDELFSGPLAEQAKIRAQSMATVLQVKIHTLNHGQTVNNLMQKQSLPPHQKDGTSCSKTVTLADLSGKKVICKTFIPGDTMAPHSAPVDVFALLLDGQMDISLGDETNRFVAGDYIVFPASMTHALACVETARLLIYK